MFFRTKEIDARLGFLQRTFHLSGDEVRSVASAFPTIVSSTHWNIFVVSEVSSMTPTILLGLSNHNLVKNKLFLLFKNVQKKFDNNYNLQGSIHSVFRILQN